MTKTLLNWFYNFARAASRTTGHPWTFLLAFFIIVVWAVSGPFFGFSDTWQLVINTGTTIITFLMVFLIQNTQNRDSEAVQIKLDELIRALRGASNDMINIEALTEEELDELRLRYERLAERAKQQLGRARDLHSEVKEQAEEAHEVKEAAELEAAAADKLTKVAEEKKNDHRQNGHKK